MKRNNIILFNKSAQKQKCILRTRDAIELHLGIAHDRPSLLRPSS